MPKRGCGGAPCARRPNLPIPLRSFLPIQALRPSFVDAYYNLGLAPQQAHLDGALIDGGDGGGRTYMSSERAFRHALALAPAERRVLSRLHTTLMWDGRHAEAAALAAHGVAIGLWAHEAQRPAHYIRELYAAPWRDAAPYAPLLARLRAAHGVLRRAAQRLRARGWMLEQPEGLQEPGQRWHVYDITAACAAAADDGGDEDDADDGAGDEEDNADETADATADASSDAAPATVLAGTCALLRALRDAGGGATPPYVPLKAQFSTMGSGVHVRPHTGPTNAKLTLHYGIEVPRGAAMRVRDETRPFEQHGLLVFDDSWEHEVWQNGSTPRTTLVLHVEHPGLTRWGAG